MSRECIYTHKEASDLIDIFTNLLDKKNILIPCADPDERKDQEEAGSCLYGEEYDMVLQSVEDFLIDYALRTHNRTLITNVFEDSAPELTKFFMIDRNDISKENDNDF